MADAASRAKASPLLSLLALGNFVVGMGVFVVIGIVSPIAEGLGISTADAGLVLTAYAIAYALLSPIGAALTGSLPRRTVLVAALGLFCLGSLLSAVSTSLLMLTASRLLVAFGAALYTPLSAGVAVAVTAPDERGWALAKVFGGMTIAQVAGVPLGAWAAYRISWHAPFFLAAGLAAVCAVVLYRAIPAALQFPSGNVRAVLGALGNLRLMVAVTFTATLMAAVYVVFTYFAPLIEVSAGSNPEARTLYLVLFGIGAMGGNYVGGYLSDRFGPLRTLLLVCVAHIVMLPLFSIMPWHPVLLALIVFAWSSFAWCFMPPQQSRLAAIAPNMVALALALNAAMIYAGIAVGSAIAAVILAQFGLPGLGVAAGLMAVLAMGHLGVSAWLSSRA
jgi:MFS transporter, DHA1 family, inner membrane transport protein